MCNNECKNCLKNHVSLSDLKKYFIKTWKKDFYTYKLKVFTPSFTPFSDHCFLTNLYTISTEPIIITTNKLIKRRLIYGN